MNKKILFIEDEREIAFIYAKVLRGYGYEVNLAYDGESGLKEAQANSYDLILLDLMLPNLSGMDVLKILRNKEKSPSFSDDTQVFILTNFEVDDVMKKDLLSMAQAYLVKVNITPRLLADMLQELDKKGGKIKSPDADTVPPTAD